MIFFKPVTDKDNPSEIIFEAIENDSVGGRCSLSLDGSKAIINQLEFDADKPYLIEGLIKSAFNFAANKNCYMGYCKCENVSNFIDKMNFSKSEDGYFNDIPSILQGNCCKCKVNI